MKEGTQELLNKWETKKEKRTKYRTSKKDENKVLICYVI